MIWCHCHNHTMWTLTLDPTHPVCWDKNNFHLSFKNLSASPWLKSQLKSSGARFDRTYSQFDSRSLLWTYIYTIPCLHNICRCIRIITVRNCSCGKVMFLHLSVSHSVPWATTPWLTPPLAHTPRQTPPGRHPPPFGDCHCSGRYASYWNAFLLLIKFTN